MAEGGPKVCWGVLGCASIAAKTCRGMLEAGQEIVAVGSRSQEKATAWVTEHAPGATAYGSYEEVLNDDMVQVVYIPLPTALKTKWVLKAAAKNKHVLCDKPLAGNFEDAQEMIDACAKAGVQFMDNTMMMHNDRMQQIKEVLADCESFGSVKTVVSSFSIPFGNDSAWAQSNIRMNASIEPLGCLGDLGWYNVRLSLWAFDYEEPEEVSCHYLEQTDDGVPITSFAILRYSGGRSATFDNSFKSSLRQWAEVVGEKRTVSMDDFVVTKVKDSATFSVAEGSIGELAETFPVNIKQQGSIAGCVQHARLPKRMAELVTGGSVDPLWPRISLQTQKVLIALHESGKSQGAWVKVAGK